MAAKEEAFVEGLVYPPPAIRELVDKTANHIGKRAEGSALEDKLRQNGSSKFNFINANDPFHAYYQHQLAQVRAGVDVSQQQQQAAQNKVEEDDGRPKVPRPAPLDFLLETPKVDPVDLDILKLTALFTARNGRRFQQELAQREKTNYQFDFLQASHSLFNYYNKLVDQYTKVLQPDAARLSKLDLQAGYGGPKGRSIAAQMEADEERRVLGRRQVMRDIDPRVEWDKWEGEQQKKREDEAEAERVAFAEIDWQDFVVVATVEFTEADDAVELPAPLSLADVQGMSLRERRRQAAQIEGRVLQNDAEEQAILREAEAAAARAEDQDDEDGMEIDREAEAAQARQQPDQIKTMDDAAPKDVKIKPRDYVPRSRRNAKVRTTACQICGQQIPVDEITEHVRIELLDPRWKEKQAVTEANRSASTLLGTGADVSASLRRLAGQRSDIFSTADSDAAKRRAAEEEARKRSKAREAVVWDGHVASGTLTTDRFNTAANLTNQIDAIHRAKGLTSAPNEPVPHIGPAGFVAPVPTSGAAPVTQVAANMTGASLSAAPQAGLSNPYTYGAATAVPGYTGIQVPGPALAPANFTAAAPAARPAEEAPEDEPAAKRARVGKMAPGQFYDEQTWIESHPNPITLIVQMPDYPDNPKWNCTGQRVPLENVPLTSLVGTVRDRIQAKTSLPIGRQQLKLNDRILTNSHTLASLNFDDGDVITLAIKEGKKK